MSFFHTPLWKIAQMVTDFELRVTFHSLSVFCCCNVTSTVVIETSLVSLINLVIPFHSICIFFECIWGFLFIVNVSLFHCGMFWYNLFLFIQLWIQYSLEISALRSLILENKIVIISSIIYSSPFFFFSRSKCLFMGGPSHFSLHISWCLYIMLFHLSLWHWYPHEFPNHPLLPIFLTAILFLLYFWLHFCGDPKHFY